MEGDDIHKKLNLDDMISIHTLRVEGDQKLVDYLKTCRRISIHTLRVEGDRNDVVKGDFTYKISIHTLRVEGDSQLYTINPDNGISIHTLRVEGDIVVVVFFNGHKYFNPHPPSGG